MSRKREMYVVWVSIAAVFVAVLIASLSFAMQLGGMRVQVDTNRKTIESVSAYSMETRDAANEIRSDVEYIRGLIAEDYAGTPASKDGGG